MNRRAIRWALVTATSFAAIAGPGANQAGATTTLTVDLAAPIRPVTHAAGGSLYGVTETLPADVNGLIGPLHPYVFVNPAADQQQPVGDAIVVAGRLAPIGARVTIRLADWLKGFYTFTSMSDWLDKIGQTVSRKQAAGLTNIYGYEIWNEPQGTYASSNPLPFNQFWMQTFTKLRQLDPGTKIIGPSIAYYSDSYMNGFLSFCKTNGCLPDIVSWHELSGQNLTGDIQTYRALEKQLGIGPLPISINEYSGAADLAVEGQPGASAPLIAKFERFQVDSACISFWDVPHPGRLGSLLASNTATNGGWWFYKWYGDMTGNMVGTTPPTPNSPSALDGFANLDTATGRASVLFGGVNDGTVQIVVKGFQAAPSFGALVHAVSEHTPFVNRTTVVNSTDQLAATDVAVASDKITVTFSGTNNNDGYRLVLTPVGGAGAGGQGGAGGAGGAGGQSGGGGAGAGAGGNGGTGGTGASGQSGAGGAGGNNSQGGAGGAGAGGSSAGAAGVAGGAGAAAGAGTAGAGTGGVASGGVAGNTSLAGGNAMAGGSVGGSSDSPATSGNSPGCSCKLVAAPNRSTLLELLSVMLVAVARRRRR